MVNSARTSVSYFVLSFIAFLVISMDRILVQSRKTFLFSAYCKVKKRFRPEKERFSSHFSAE